jgi:hypothetical protein
MSAVRFFHALPTAIVITGLASLSLLSIGCSEDPTEANALTAALPLKAVIVRDTTVTATGSDSFRQYLVHNDVVSLAGGSGGYQAVAAIQFQGFPTRDTVRVFSATVTLRCLSWSGDSTADLLFRVYRITRGWNSSTATWDTLQTNFYDPSSDPLAVRSIPTLADTQSISFAIDTAMVREWLATGTDSTNTKYGIVLFPDPACRIVRGFNAFAYDSTQFWPLLTVVAGNQDGSSLDTSTFAAGVNSFFGNIDNLNADAGLIYAQCGVDYRSTLSFDLSFVPRGAIVNRADLYLTRDPATSRLTKFSDSSFTVQASLSTTDHTLLDYSYAVGVRMTDSAQTFHADIRRPAQLWVHGENNGLTVSPSLLDDNRSFDLLTFKSATAANAADRPRLRITFTTAR